MNRLEKILAAIAALLAVVVGVLWLMPERGAGDAVSGEFTDTQALSQSELAKLDIIPAWLPAAATALKIRKNGTIGALAFRFEETDTAELREACPRNLTLLPEMPEVLDAGWKPAKPDAFYLCPQGFLAIDGKQRSALLWR